MKPRRFDCSILERLADKFTVGDDCWEWTASLDRHGYGQVRYCGTMRRAHRVVYEALTGSIDDERELDHLCRNPRCVRPDHLEPVTHRENLRRGRWAQTTHCPQGHEYNDANTGVRPNGSRYCRACAREWTRARKARSRG